MGSRLNERSNQIKESGGSALDAFLDYTSEKGLTLYPAQEEAILELEAGKNVILNTPTGSGKSLVAAYLHFQALSQNRRSIYTCPIKALVNEKFLSLCQDFGADQVGMITGDATVNPDAPIICCTAEILSNLALREGAETPYLDVIVDEFHYYSDRGRGVAWQIPLLTLSKSRFLLMSATLGDTVFFEKELTALNGFETLTIKSGERPVPLDFEYSERALHFKIADLLEQKKAPIYLVNFTQRECAEEAQKLLSTDFCTKEEKKRITEEVREVDFKSPYGKDVERFLKHGVGLHHAGLLPRYRVLVEKLAQKGLLKIIMGTDTLGVGVNVPIRTVLFTKLCKYDGEKTTLLKVRDFQQIAGRAGRKGFDDRGSVVVQAPEHAIENLALEQKAAGDPKKAKKIVKRKPPEKGYIPWTKETLTQLSEGQPEPLVSRFDVDHAMILNVLSRQGTKNCDALRDLIRSSHESQVQKKKHGKHAFQLFRSLVERQIITFNPLSVNVDLQEDFSLNHALALFLIDTIALLDPNDLLYPLDLLTLVESILENPDLILRRQVDKAKTLRMEEMKASGMEYEERIAELEKVEYPKPNQEFIYSHFNEFSRNHPWVKQENIRPKSIAREMYETYQSFPEYIREYGLERTEGLLLRYINETYKVLVQTVPDAAKTEEVLVMIEYFREILKTVDSSLLDEWEKLRNPEEFAGKLQAREEQAERERLAQLERDRLAKLEKTKEIIIRNEIFRVLRELARGSYEDAGTLLQTNPADLEKKMEEYFVDHQRLSLDPKARSPHFTKITRTTPDHFQINQTLHDPEDHDDWILSVDAEVILSDGQWKPALKLISLSG